MWVFTTICDEFCVAGRVFFKLELAPSRETLLHFFEQVRRAYPRMTRLRRRDDDTLVLDEPPGSESWRRFLRTGTDNLRFGQFGPPGRDEVSAFGKMVLTHAPCYLSLSALDYASIEAAFSFDLEYTGNHDELVAETLLRDSPLQAALVGDQGRVIDCRPCIGAALSEDCSTQAYIEVRSRTSMHEVRSSEYEPQVLSVYLTLSRDFRDGPADDLAAVHDELLGIGEGIAAERIVPQIVQPLRQAIASRH